MDPNELVAEAENLFAKGMGYLRHSRDSIRQHYDDILEAEKIFWKMEVLLDQVRKMLPPVSQNIQEYDENEHDSDHSDHGRYGNILLTALRKLAHPADWPELLQEARKRTTLDEIRLKDRELARLIRDGKVTEHAGKYVLS